MFKWMKQSLLSTNSLCRTNVTHILKEGQICWRDCLVNSLRHSLIDGITELRCMGLVALARPKLLSNLFTLAKTSTSRYTGLAQQTRLLYFPIYTSLASGLLAFPRV